MLVTEMLSETRIRHYSDQDMMIRQIETDILYEDAVDNYPCKYTYEETDISIEHIEPDVSDDMNQPIPN